MSPLFHQNRYFIDFEEKPGFFNFFADQSYELPLVFLKRTKNLISSVTFNKDNIAKIVQNLDPSKAHVHEMSSIHMLKICGKSICKLCQVFSKSSIEKVNFLVNRRNQTLRLKKNHQQKLKTWQTCFVTFFVTISD